MHLQNDYDELHALLDWAVPGGLGDRSQFQEYYEAPIKMAQKKDIDDTALGRVSRQHWFLTTLCRMMAEVPLIKISGNFPLCFSPPDLLW